MNIIESFKLEVDCQFSQNIVLRHYSIFGIIQQVLALLSAVLFCCKSSTYSEGKAEIASKSSPRAWSLKRRMHNNLFLCPL
jgi:hypothetical protein